MTRLVMLDNEAMQALRDPAHPKHRHVVSHAQAVASRKRRAAAIEVVVPTAVRVEAGWDRTSPAWAFPNHLRIADVPLDAANAAPQRPFELGLASPSPTRTWALSFTQPPPTSSAS
jgi:hypothetical protein